jgi:hypothetical protein
MMYDVLVSLIWQVSVSSPTAVQVPSTGSPMPTMLPILLSSIALFISLISLAFNSYYQYFKRPDTRLLVADELEAWLSPKGELIFNITVTIFNEGARYGAISRIVGKVRSPQNPQATRFRWRMFVDHKNVGAEGTRFTPHLAFAGWAHALVIPARQALAKHVQFVTLQPLDLNPGSYTFEFLGFLGDVRKPRAKASMLIDMSEDQVSSLRKATSDPDTRVSKTSVRLARRLQTVDW